MLKTKNISVSTYLSLRTLSIKSKRSWKRKLKILIICLTRSRRVRAQETIAMQWKVKLF